MLAFRASNRPVQASIFLFTLTFVVLSLYGLHHARQAGDSVAAYYTTAVYFPHKQKPTEARQLSAKELMSRPLATDQTKAPKLFHQSWQNSTLPAKFHQWSQSCRKIHPDWEWVLWTDADNLQLVKKYAPWFLDTYEELKSEIYRADAARNIYMHVFGGVYADLDTECLLPYDSMFEKHNITTVPHGKLSQPQQPVSAAAPPARKAFLGRMGINAKAKHSIPNAWMASTPGHPFWLLPLEVVENNIKDHSVIPEALTGPDALFLIVNSYQKTCANENSKKLDEHYAYSDWRHLFQSTSTSTERVMPTAPQSLEILPHTDLYAYWWGEERLRRVCLASDPGFDPETCKDVVDVEGLGSYSISYWSHSWDADKGHKQESMDAIEGAIGKPWKGLGGGT